MDRGRSLIRILMPALAIAGIATPAIAQKKNPEGARVLLLSGGQRQHHGYRDQAFYLASALEDTGRYEVTINEDAALLTAPELGRYDVIVAIADRRDPEFKYTEAQQRALLDFVKGGKGYVSIHGADNAAADWLPEWREMLGAVFSHDTQGGKYPDSKTRKGTYTIRITNTNHPVTKGLKDFALKDELYYHLQMGPKIEPLAVTQHDGQDWPVAWTRDHGRGKVFHTPLGHRDFGPDKDDPLRDPNLGKLVIQGIDWVAAGIGKGRP